MGCPKNKRVPFGYIVDKYPTIVVDTSAAQGYLLGRGNGSKNDTSFLILLANEIKRGVGCVLPELIIKELESFSENRIPGKKYRTELIDIYRKMQKKNKLYFDQKDIMSKVLRESKKYPTSLVSIEDLSVLVQAKEARKTGSPSAIISNDVKGLAWAWRRDINDKYISPRTLGFFPRVGPSTFEVFT